MHVAHFVQRYPPAVGGSEAYFARLGEYLGDCGDEVTVWTSTAVELGEMWGKKDPSPRPPPLRREGEEDPSHRLLSGSPSPPGGGGRGEGSLPAGGPGLFVHRYPPAPLPLRRYLLKAASLLPVRP
ncbi:MAG: hypothetical protein K2X87_04800, partial [Gemmataceae bacterium]|nr:hypothetical protein [Gemmataceae bacterium]